MSADRAAKPSGDELLTDDAWSSCSSRVRRAFDPAVVTVSSIQAGSNPTEIPERALLRVAVRRRTSRPQPLQPDAAR
jgi:metal-dependent amidase/aminoacylase/carboxypeptidase family protein